MQYLFKRIGKSDMHRVQPLWNALNRLHHQESRYFKEHFASFTFEKRCEKFSALRDADVYIEIITPREDDAVVGYCIATIDREKGEIDSLFIEDGCRGRNLGTMLVEHALSWLRDNGCQTIVVSVADGHEYVFDFYRKFGFFPRLTYLQLRPAGDETPTSPPTPREYPPARS